MEDKVIKYEQFCKYLSEEYINELSGEGKKNEYIYGQRPGEKIIIGILDSGTLNDPKGKYRSLPVAKVQFFINNNEKGKLHINLKGNLFYNVVPSFAEQEKIMQEELNKTKFVSKENGEEIEEEPFSEFSMNKIIAKFKRKKIDEHLKDIVIDVEELVKNRKVDFSEEINNRMKNIDFSDAVFFKSREIPERYLSDEETFNKYISTTPQIVRNVKLTKEYRGLGIWRNSRMSK